jgi:hypothetical protein
VKLKRHLAYALLSLLLLISQQLSLVHGYAHVAGKLAPTAAVQNDDGGGVKRLAADDGCASCLVAAQLASALTGPAFRFFSLDCDYGLPQALALTTLARLFGGHYHSRAPPQA